MLPFSAIRELWTSRCSSWFRKGRGTRAQIANIHWIIKKAREFQEKIYFCFIDYAKAFDCVDHNKVWKILKEMGIPDRLTCLLRNLYAGQEVTVLNIHWRDWCWSWNSNTLVIWFEELPHLKKPWCWERLMAGGEGDSRGWDGWMVSPTQWTWVWVSCGSWVMVREAWCAAVQEVAKSRTWLSDWTELNWRNVHDFNLIYTLIHFLAFWL